MSAFNASRPGTAPRFRPPFSSSGASMRSRAVYQALIHYLVNPYRVAPQRNFVFSRAYFSLVEGSPLSGTNSE